MMLQGAASAPLVDLVKASGGTITHNLNLIGAVGARMTRSQLDDVLRSPLVERHLDDLSVRPPEKAPDSGCDVGGALELEIAPDGVKWQLFNKLDSPVKLEQLSLEWPQALGALKVARLGTADLAVPPEPGAATPLELHFDAGDAPLFAADGALTLAFQKKIPPNAMQREFQIEANFSGDCSTKLVPGYADNHHDFYFAGVVGADELHRHGITGKGVTVAVLDSGLWEHSHLVNDSKGKPRVIARYDAIRNTEGEAVFDESGHGSHMTSVLAHSGPVTRGGRHTGSFKGIAPDASLVAVKAFDDEGQGELLDIVRGIQWVVENREKYNIRVLNLSFASRPRWNYWLDPVNQAAMHAWANGIAVVAAAGNEGPEAMTVGSPGNLPYAITVGALTDSWTPENRDDDYIPDFSSRGPTPSAHIKPDVVAPGGHITGITRPGASLMQEYPEYRLATGEFVMSGSSQASALVAGIAALLLQLEPDLSPDDVKCKLTSSAEPAINSDGLLAYSPFQQGHGYVSATRAVTLGERGCGNPELDIEQELAREEHFQGPATVDPEGEPTLPGLPALLSPQPSTKGLSMSRKWGAKAHMERREPSQDKPQEVDEHPFDWESVYLREKAIIERLSQPPGN